MAAPLDHLRSAFGEVMSEQPVSHSPLPWRIGAEGSRGEWFIDAAWPSDCVGDPTIAIVDRNPEADAAFIVRACNSHAALVEALKECSFRLAALVAASGDFSDVNAKALDAATAALAKAETE